MRQYELVYILAPDLDEGVLVASMEKVSGLIAARGGAIEKTEQWGRRKLAYEIKSQGEGYYVLSQFRMDPKLTGEVEESLRISEEVLRHLLVRIGE